MKESGGSQRRKGGSVATRARAQKREELAAKAVDLYRDAILAAAEQVFAGSGVAAARMADIAREAGMAVGSLYKYFDSKEQIFESLIERRTDEFHQEAERLLAESEGALDSLSRVVAHSLGHLEQHRGMFMALVQLGVLSEVHVRRAGECAERGYERFLRLYGRVLREAVEEGILRDSFSIPELTAYLTGTINGLVRAWVAQGGKKGLAANAPRIVEFFLRGASQP